MSKVATSLLFSLALGSQAGPVTAQDKPDARPVAKPDPAEVQPERPPDRQEKRGEDPCNHLKKEDCNFRRAPGYKGGPCQGGMCPPGKPDYKRRLEESPLLRPSRTR
ncbi:hypothetical protein [Pseudoduganella armeniaca]|uniref:hypothetical protein n=1 Tax=Pseudoduganella armeniaca TaxID=2072590 RepID=UPI0015E7B124|nr:hypothetical protein [Pseudoduganella armeniaca]